MINPRVKHAEDIGSDDRGQSIRIKIAPLSASIIKFIPYTDEELQKIRDKQEKKSIKMNISKGEKKC